MRPGDRVLQQRAVGDRPGQWAFVAVVIEVEDSHLGNAPVRGLESDDTAERRGNPDRAADVGTGRERCRPGGERRGRSAAGTTRRVPRVPRITGDTPEARPGHRRAGELWS